ncbi:MAG: rhomboid family intramembrane serine protease [Chitinophagales bacterium]
MTGNKVVYTHTFIAQGGKQPAVVIGALARYINNQYLQHGLRWELIEVTRQFDLAAVIYHNNLREQPIILAVAQQDKSSYHIRLQSSADWINEEQLQQYAVAIEAGWQQVLQQTPVYELRMEYNRRLQESEIGKLNGSVDKDESTFKWAFKVLFTNHPVQAVAWIAITNIAVFIAMVIAGVGFFDPAVDKVIQWGAASKQQVFEGEYWRLLTANFVHFGIGHLAGNMIALLFASAFLMMVLNKWQFLIGYLITGIFSFAVSIWWHIDTVTAGASGAIFGCYGILLGLALTPLFTKSDRSVILMYLVFYAGFNLLYGLKDGIDNAAHIGGLTSGVVVGLLYYVALKRGNLALNLLVLLLVVGLGLAATYAILQPAQQLYKLDRKYSALEHEGIEQFNVRDTSAEVEMLALDKSLTAFHSAMSVANEMAALPYKPSHQQRYTNRLIYYTGLRITEIELLQAAFNNGSNQWDDSIGLTSTRIDSVLNEFKNDY